MIIGLVVCFVGYFADLQPLMTNYKTLKELNLQNMTSLNLLKEKNQNQMKAHQQGMVSSDQSFNDLLSNLYRVARVNGVLIEKLWHVKTPNLILDNQVVLTIQSDYQSIVRFLIDIDNKNYPFFIQRFVMQSFDNNLFLLKVTFLLLQTHRVFKQSLDKTHVLYDPFCKAKTWTTHDENHLIQLTPIALMTMVGSMQDDKHRFALMSLPEQVVFVVEVGSLVGIEKWKVVGIFSDHINLERDQQKMMISMLSRDV